MNLNKLGKWKFYVRLPRSDCSHTGSSPALCKLTLSHHYAGCNRQKWSRLFSSSVMFTPSTERATKLHHCWHIGLSLAQKYNDCTPTRWLASTEKFIRSSTTDLCCLRNCWDKFLYISGVPQKEPALSVTVSVPVHAGCFWNPMPESSMFDTV